jgi:hypothetical protein
MPIVRTTRPPQNNLGNALHRLLLSQSIFVILDQFRRHHAPVAYEPSLLNSAASVCAQESDWHNGPYARISSRALYLCTIGSPAIALMRLACYERSRSAPRRSRHPHNKLDHRSIECVANVRGNWQGIDHRPLLLDPIRVPKIERGPVSFRPRSQKNIRQGLLPPCRGRRKLTVHGRGARPRLILLSFGAARLRRRMCADVVLQPLIWIGVLDRLPEHVRRHQIAEHVQRRLPCSLTLLAPAS